MPNYRRVFITGYCYFLTVVAYKRNPILIENIDLLRDSFKRNKNVYKYSIEAIVILPDHFHLIIKPQEAKEFRRNFMMLTELPYSVN